MQISIIKKLMLTRHTLAKLQRLEKPPTELSYIGEQPSNLLEGPCVAIVGTRKMSAYGKAVTEKIATELARAGVVIISGNALGVDVTAQKAALEAGGKVIAVVASGLDKVYPATNAKVAERIVAQGGSIISEYEPTHMPRPEEFLERNRIIAGLSDVVVVTEAAARSGSLNTALHAQKAGIAVFAVPGPITSSLSEGPNHLIKQGASTVTSANDILQHLGLDQEKTQLSLMGGNDKETRILQLISEGCHDFASLQSASELDFTALQSALTMLEIDGRITQNSLGNWRLQ